MSQDTLSTLYLKIHSVTLYLKSPPYSQPFFGTCTRALTFETVCQVFLYHAITAGMDMAIVNAGPPKR